MQKKQIVFSIFFISLVLQAPVVSAETATQTLRRMHKRINTLLGKKFKDGSAADRKNKDEIKKEINTLLDFKELARLSLGRHWSERSEKEQQEFVDVLKDLIERNYIKQLRSNLGYQLEYLSEEKKSDALLVKTVVRIKKNKRLTEIFIDYKMRKVQASWMVFDVVTDEVSLVRNYRSQFNRIIRKESYDALVKKMRRKIEENDNDTPQPS